VKKFVFPVILLALAILIWFSITTLEKLNKKNIDFLSAVPSSAHTIIGTDNLLASLLKLEETSSVWKQIKTEGQIATVFNDIELLLKENTSSENIQLAIIFSSNGTQKNTTYLFSGLTLNTSGVEKEFAGKNFFENTLSNKKFYSLWFRDFLYVSSDLVSIQDVITSINTNSFLTHTELEKTALSKSETKDFFVLNKGILSAESSEKAWAFYDGEVFINSITLLGAYSKPIALDESLTLNKLLPQHYSFQVKPANDSVAFASEWATIQDAKGNKAMVFKLRKSLRYTTLADAMQMDTLSPQRFTVSTNQFNDFIKLKWLAADTLYGVEEVDYAVISDNATLAANLSFEIKNTTIDHTDFVAESFNINTNNTSSQLAIIRLFSNAQLSVKYNAYTTPDNDFVIDRLDITNQTQVSEVKSDYLWQKSIGSIKQGPFLIKNHRTNNQEILVVDSEHKLHLIGVNGEVKWTKALTGDIIGDVEQVDILNNKRYQLLFNTSSKLYLVDILGRDIDGFPISSNEKITNQVAAIDYENNKNYRFIFATEQRLLAYDKQAKRLDGFQHVLKGHTVTSQLKHFVLSGNDYVVFNTSSGKLFFLNRKGEERYNSNANSSAHNVFFTINTQQNLAGSSVFHIDTLGRIVELSLAEQSATTIKDPNVSNKLIVADVAQNKRYFLALKERQVNIYTRTGNLLNEISCEFSPVNGYLFSDNLQTGKLLIHSSNNELYVYDFKQNKFVKALNNVTSTSPIYDIDRSGKANVVVVQNGKLVCYEL
jgi:hypothetical protein